MPRARLVRLEAVAAVSAFLLTFVAALAPQWVEALTGLDPDGGSGTLEWLLPVALLAVAASLGLDARRRLVALHR